MKVSQTEKDNDNKKRRWLTVAGGVVMQLAIGNLYLWGNIGPYVISYFHHLGDPSAVNSQTSSIIPFSLCVKTMFNSLGPLLQKKMNTKLLLTITSTAVISAIFLASRAQTWSTFKLIYVTVFPMAAGIMFYVPICCAWEWFTVGRGFITGLLYGAFGMGAFTFDFITVAIVNPDNLQRVTDEETNEDYFPKEVAMRVPYMFTICCITWGSMLLISIFLIERNPAFVQRKRIEARQLKLDSIQSNLTS